ncbi:hypothetical protein OH492_07055 [Vibrio chagasii]|nr:hypothetical protein [Vibrio chagasii]
MLLLSTNQSLNQFAATNLIQLQTIVGVNSDVKIGQLCCVLLPKA